MDPVLYAPKHKSHNSCNKNNNSGVVDNRQGSTTASSSSSSDSGSEDGAAKKKRRSHRPRGCRGGGSRRARKERRELLFLAQKQQQAASTTANELPYLPPLKQTISGSSTNFHLQRLPNNVFRSNSEIQALPSLLSTSSYSSSESSDSSELMQFDKSSNGFDILPSMPAPAPFDPYNRSNNYKSMSALPPLAAVAPRPYQMNNDKQSTRGNTATTGQKAHNVANTTATAANHVPASGNINQNQPFCRILGEIHNHNHHNTSNYHTERIKKQQEMLAGGGSLFATSPKSFLLGKNKATTSFCF